MKKIITLAVVALSFSSLYAAKNIGLIKSNIEKSSNYKSDVSKKNTNTRDAMVKYRTSK